MRDDTELPDLAERLVGLTVSECGMSYQVTLRMSVPGGCRFLQLQSPFTLEFANGTFEIDPSGPREALAPALRLFMRDITGLDLDRMGNLVVRFSPDGVVRMPAGGGYEAWEFGDETGLRVICKPCGGLDVSIDPHQPR